ncbi:vimentin-like isoform X4 [Neoarius graeffei]|uniref:vimentin-like isoform X4 n=1 Tax=Neoarius graeffei TaxID=443677 RepID=UPI00298C625E|nr:vimentin-like isoform X4 [Neoarius graeffei]
MRGSCYSQKTLTVSGSSRMRVQSPSPSRCRASTSSSVTRGRAGFQGGAVEIGTELHQYHANEKEEMQVLNARFAGYIEKVQALEQRNAALREELQNLQSRYKVGPGGLDEEYEAKFKEMKELIAALTAEKGAADIERGYVEEEVELWTMKLEEELALKEEAEMILREFREDVDNATLQKADLERRVEQLVAEIEFLKKLHSEEVAELMKQIKESKVTVELDSDRPDLVAHLRKTRAEIEAVAARNVQEAEKWYKGKFDTLKESAAKREIQVNTMREEISTLSSEVSDLQNQIDALRAKNAALEQQLDDMEMSHLDRVSNLEAIIAQLENQLCETKKEMAKYFADYQELLNIKLKLDAEIATYRKLLEGEERRLGISVSEKTAETSTTSSTAVEESA